MSSRPTQRARRLRRSSTSGEVAAWKVLRTLRQYGYPVRRQHPINGIVVDFAIPKAKLVIEFDGGIHRLAYVADKDAMRDRILIEAGWAVLRVPNDLAFQPDHLFALIGGKLGISGGI